jgi:nucleoside-diphosphate-sugar epimerase
VKPLPHEDLDHVLQHTAPLWERARGRRLFLSGGTGFFGAWLLESLAHCSRELGLGLRATVLSRDPATFLERMPHLANEPALEFLKGDVREFAFPAGEFDYVIHGAAPTSLADARRPAELLSVLVRGGERMVEFTETCGARSFLLVSSGAVYGRQPEGMTHIAEDYRGGPDWLDADAVYAEGKRVCEQMTALLAGRSAVRCAIARCFTFVGPHLPLDQHFAIGNFIADALAGRPLVVLGDGTPVRSYLHAADLAVWLWTLALRAPELDANPAVYNVGSGERVSVRQLAERVAAAIDPALRVEVLGASALGAKRVQYVPDVRKAETELGLRAWIGLDEAIKRTAAWYRDSGQ